MSSDLTPAVRAFIDFANAPSSSGAPNWSEVTKYVKSFDVKRGRAHALDRVEAANATVTLDNTDGSFDPTNPSSPYVGNLKPMRRIWLACGYGVVVSLDMPNSFWRMNERWLPTIVGGNLFDECGNGRGTFSVSVSGMGASGALNAGTSYSVLFNGSSEMATGAMTSANALGDSFTLEALVYPTTTAGVTGTVLAARAYDASGVKATAGGWQLQIAAGKPTLIDASGNIVAQATGTIASGTWTALALSKSGTASGACALYLNGVSAPLGINAAATLGSAFDPANSFYQFAAGYTYSSDTTARFFAGRLQEVAIYSHVLAATAVANHHAEAASGTYDFSLFQGFVEDFPQDGSSPYETETALPCTDALAALANLELNSIYDSVIKADAPLVRWQLNETSGTLITDTGTGGNKPGTYVADASAFTASGLIKGSTKPFATIAGTAGVFPTPRIGTVPAVLGTIGTHFAFEGWFSGNITSASGLDDDLTMYIEGSSFLNSLSIDVLPTEVSINFHRGLSGAGTYMAATGFNFGDGKAHHLVFTRSFNNFQAFIDGTLAASETVTGVVPPDSLTAVIGIAQSFSNSKFTMGQLAIYNYTLTAAQVAAHYQAGANPWGGDYTGQRVSHVLDFGGWPDRWRWIDQGLSMLPAVDNNSTPEGNKALDLINNTADSEGGYVFVDSRGRVVFRARDTFFRDPASNSSQATFGDTGGDLTFDDVQFDSVVDRIVNDITVTTAAGDVEVQDQDSITDYFLRSTSLTTFLATLTEGQAVGTALLFRYSQPVERIASLEVMPLGSLAVWQQVVTREMADAITVKRTRPGGNVIDSFSVIEGVETSYDAATNEWDTVWNLSPQDSSTYMILDDPVFSLLDSGNLLYY